MSSSPSVMDEPGRVMDEPGRVMDEPGRLMDEPGRVMDEPGRVMDEPGRVVYVDRSCSPNIPCFPLCSCAAKLRAAGVNCLVSRLCTADERCRFFPPPLAVVGVGVGAGVFRRRVGVPLLANNGVPPRRLARLSLVSNSSL